ncbi:putative acetyltransferase [Pedobacter psychrotolerans]|uniref:N-acetyltransferase n=1 Tax=Pedobacter psychrotolerans TaxID=1843235 RepID=A0A4R2HQA3_9SPHI|nr:GNAT family N-acetyltransferase [Pedobacter psychrotolerans]TCO30911.1 putative acetyltransferase [Pedobacter psychrotolerans]GGE43609.1 N-acetyltransferase [Pedobacter psychrotolerans]
MAIIYRTIEEKDNQELASLIRTVLREFKIDKPGTVYTDPTTDHLSKVFELPQSAYWIAEEDGVIIGGCGIFPTSGLPEGCVELVKLYTAVSARGKGIGKMLMQKSISSAQHFGYNEIYLESFPELSAAIGMYEKAGFKKLSAPLGQSGHFACNIWMLLVL